DAGDVLRVLEEEPRVESPRQTRLDVAIETERVALLEDQRHIGRLRRKAADRLVLAIEEELRPPDEAAVARLAERRVPIGEVGARQVPLAAVLNVDLRRVRVAAAEVDAVLVVQVEKGRGAAEIGEFRKIARDGV